jgi:hypothetical protein
MSSSVVSNQNLTDFSVVNAVVSASVLGELLSNNPALLEQATFNAKVSLPNSITLASGSTQTHELTSADVAHAVSNALTLNVTGAGAVLLNFGMTATVLVSVLNLSATNPFVNLNFKAVNVPATATVDITAVGGTGITITASPLFTAVNGLLNVVRVIWTSASAVTLTCGTERAF